LKIEIKYDVHAEPEDVPVRGNAVVSGDLQQDKEVEDRILTRLAGGEVWAWCYVVVTAILLVDGTPFIQANNTLGCCSYVDEEDFCKDSGYFENMKKEAKNTLKTELSALVLRGQTAKNALRRFK
jgi:hypothetical protein